MVCERSSQRPPRSLGGEDAVTVRETWWVCGEQGFGLALRDDRCAGGVGGGTQAGNKRLGNVSGQMKLK